jgi:hypothetical protein
MKFLAQILFPLESLPESPEVVYHWLMFGCCDVVYELHNISYMPVFLSRL